VTFRNILNETYDSSYTGLDAYGDLFNISIAQSKNNNLMEIVVQGRQTLSSIKSAETLKSEYQEKDWITIEKLWAKMAHKRGKEIDTLLHKFEKDLNKVVVQMQKDMDVL
jgi:hypothetical protein